MKMSKMLKHYHRLQQILFYVLLLVVTIALAVLSHRYSFEFDWTAHQRHTLSTTTTTVLADLNSPITIEVFISPGHQYQTAIQNLLKQYQQHTQLLNITFIDPVRQPERVRELAIQQQAEMVVSGQQGQQHVFDLSEQSLTNAIIKVSRHQRSRMIFITGHGERDVMGESAFDLSQWRNQLSMTGIEVDSLPISEALQQRGSEDNMILVIASSQQVWPQKDIDLLQQYLRQGGNLLWLSEPNTDTGLSPITEQLNLSFIPGILIDPNADKLGLEDPRFVVVMDYANHPVTSATSSVTLMPGAHAIQSQFAAESTWKITKLLQSQSDSWIELGEINAAQLGRLQFDEAVDIAGSFLLSILLEQPISATQNQRIAIFGDGDFVSNSYLGTAANLELAMAVSNWLIADEDKVHIPVVKTRDNQLILTARQTTLIGLGFLLVLPVALLIMGLSIWYIRKRR